jgi:ComF family protein
MRATGAIGRLSALGCKALLAALARPRCAGCDALLRREAVFCRICEVTVEAIPSAIRIDGLRIAAFGAYGGALADGLRRFKYHGRPDLARPLGELLRLAAQALPEQARWDVILPVPLHPLRLAGRGYNQASLLARATARDLAVAVRPGWLRRTVNTPAQAQLDAAARRENVRRAFVANRRVEGKRVLLVDDVATTGATLTSCAEALGRAGASVDHALVVAIRT